MGISRRDFLKATAAGAVLTGIGLPSSVFGAQKKVKIGFLAPLTGEVAGWGLPGLYGCEIWGEWINNAGGMKIGGDRYMVEFVSYDKPLLAPKHVVKKHTRGHRDLLLTETLLFNRSFPLEGGQISIISLGAF